ncbi:MAG: FHA domain-containing protein [Deltaproteobacteria bacterium]|nr:FHA domain-containing protein [Deltaproteobacteria bacterium]
MKVFLEVDKGHNAGARYEIPARSYRAVGRAGGADLTVQLSKDGDQVLDPDDIRRVEAHLRKRSGKPAGVDKPRLGAFSRGRDIRLEDEKISRAHAMVFVDDDGVSVVDLGSTNGTRVNANRIEDAELTDGDIVNIGKTRFVVKIEP